MRINADITAVLTAVATLNVYQRMIVNSLINFLLSLDMQYMVWYVVLKGRVILYGKTKTVRRRNGAKA